MQPKSHTLLARHGAIAMACFLALVGVLFTAGCAQPQAPTTNAESTSETEQTSATSEESAAATEATATDDAEAGDPLSLWTDEAPLKKELTEYIAATCDESSADFIPVEDRIAVFDFDGTLFCETDPNYFDYTLLVYRVTEDPDYKDKASDFEKQVANKIIDQNENGTKYEELPVEHGQAVASAFKGMTPDEFTAYIQKFKQTDMPSYEGMKRGYGFYQPMVEVVNYLKDNDFTVYIVSGTDRLITRGIFAEDCVLDIPPAQIIGSDETFVATNEGDEDGLDYTYSADDELVTGGEFIIKNLKMNKVSAIQREIGQQPVLSFGNSSGDFAMDNYTITNNKYKAAAFQLCCDDTERENGKLEKAEEMRTSCEENGYTAVSMKDDWTTIYGDGVTYTGASKKEEATEDKTEGADLKLVEDDSTTETENAKTEDAEAADKAA